MGYQYSPSLNVFLEDSLKENYLNDDYPADALDIDEPLFWAYSGAPPEGKVRIAGEDGLPAWADLPPPTAEEKIHAMEAMRAQLLAYADEVTADWRTELALDEISNEDKAKLSAWMAYKRQVKAITAEVAIADGFEWPAMPAV